MKKLLAILLLAGCVQGAAAQNNGNEKTLFEEVTGIKKKTDKFNLYLNMNASYDAMDGYSDPVKNKFNVRQLRIEAKGNVNDWLSYRWRQRLNRPNNGGANIDNTPTSIDIAAIGVKLSDKWSLFAGKQCAAYGGIEFDLNPIEIYEYSDMIDWMSNFLTGVNIGYDFAAGQQLNFQVLNSLNGPSSEMYGDLEATKTPLVYTLNWNGNFNNVFKTRWSASVMNETKGKKMYYFAFGNELTLDKFNMFFDVMYSKDDVDRSGIMTSIVGQQNSHNVLNAGYLSLVTKLNYRFATNWNVFVKGMYETASITKASQGVEKGKYRTSLGYLAGLEYYPMENSNLHFFLTYVGRSYKYENRANAEDYDTNRVSLGFIYQLQMF